MKRNFTNENFEGFLRQNADDLRLQPSAKVWRGISKSLNRRRRIFGFVLGFTLLITTGVGYYLNNQPGRNPEPVLNTNGQSSPLKNLQHFNIINSGTLIQNDRTGDLSNTVLVSKPGVIEARSIETGNAAATEASLLAQNEFRPQVVDSYFGDLQQPESALPAIGTNQPPAVPLTIESVVNLYKPAGKRRFGSEIYFTPTVSYRKLNDNNIDKMVTHKPSFGFELGWALKYRLVNNLKIRGGLQFNMSRYDIQTFNTTTQLATIRLNTGNGVDSFRTATNYNNFNGYETDWLQNFSFQISAPVGIELKLRGDDRMQFGIATTIQPTYILGDRAYLISSDYKNYAEAPKLVRHWNVNTSLETFVSYSTGHLNWQVGPQVRYQLLSSYVKKYPVKENLFDFGLKVGISLNNH